MIQTSCQATARAGRPEISAPTTPQAINDLALDVDGRSLYLATDRGLWRLRLDRIPPPQPPAQVPSPAR
jgi:hypothetical protein